MTANQFRKKPVVIEAMQWTGGEYGWLGDWLGNTNWGRADAHDVPWEHEDSEQVVIFNSLEKVWIPVPVGHWIIRGVRGEFYPCEPDTFRQTYDPIPASAYADNKESTMSNATHAAREGDIVTSENVGSLPWRTVVLHPSGMVWLRTTDRGWVSAVGRTVTDESRLVDGQTRIIHLPIEASHG